MNSENAPEGQMSERLLYALRWAVPHCIDSQDSIRLGQLVRSNFFERKSESAESISIVADARLLLRNVGTLLSAIDACCIWAQWLRFGLGHPTRLRVILDEAVLSADPGRCSHEAIPDPAEWVRVNLTVRALIPGTSALPLGQDIPLEILDEHDLGGVVGSIIHYLARSPVADKNISLCLTGFDRILAWLLAARNEHLSPDARRFCFDVALDLAAVAHDHEKVTLLRWLVSEIDDVTQLPLGKVIDLLGSIQADLLVPEALLALRQLLSRAFNHSVSEAAGYVAQIDALPSHMFHLFARCRAESIAARIQTRLGSPDKAVKLLDKSARVLNAVKLAHERELDVGEWLLATVDIGQIAQEYLPELIALADTVAAGNDAPAVVVARDVLRYVAGEGWTADTIGQEVMRLASGASSPWQRHRFIEMLCDLVRVLPGCAFSAELGRLAQSLVTSDTVPDKTMRGRLLLRLLASGVGVETTLIKEFSSLTDLEERAARLLQLAAWWAPWLRVALSPLALPTARGLYAAGKADYLASLTRACLLAGCAQVLQPLLDDRAIDLPVIARRALAASLASLDSAQLMHWAEQQNAPTGTLPMLSWLASLSYESPESIAATLQSLLAAIPSASDLRSTVVEGLSLLLWRSQNIDGKTRSLITAWYQEEPPLAPEAMLRRRAQWVHVLVALDEREMATRALHRLLEGFRTHPDVALQLHVDALDHLPPYLVGYWLRQMTHELLNQPLDHDRMLMNVVTSCRVALLLPPGIIDPQDAGNLFHATVNLPSYSARDYALSRLGYSWLARVEWHHHTRITLDGRNNTVLDHMLARYGTEVEVSAPADARVFSRYLAEAATNLFACDALDTALMLLHSAVEHLHEAIEQINTPFFVADAWLACKKVLPVQADELWPLLEQQLHSSGWAPDAALVAQAEIGVRSWSSIATHLSLHTLEMLSHRWGTAAMPPAKLAALLEASLPYPHVADRLCATALFATDVNEVGAPYKILDPLTAGLRGGADHVA